MTRSKKSAKSRPSVNVRDLRAKADPKGGATDGSILSEAASLTSDKKSKSTTPTESVSINFTKISNSY